MVQRWREWNECDPVIDECNDGEYVLYTDYATLEAENARLKELLKESKINMEADCREDCEWPCPDSVACARKKILIKICEVLGDE